jgi:hypothetical protein
MIFKTPSHDIGPLPVSEQVPLLSLLEEAVALGARLATYGEPRAAVGAHVQSLLPRAVLAAPSVYAPVSPHRTLGVVALRAALQSGYDEGSERGWTRTAEAQNALASHGAAERAHGVLTALYGSLTASA